MWPWNRAYDNGEAELDEFEFESVVSGDIKSRWLLEEPPIKLSDMRIQSCIELALLNSYSGRGPSGPFTASSFRADERLAQCMTSI